MLPRQCLRAHSCTSALQLVGRFSLLYDRQLRNGNDLQELESIAHRTASWEVLQRGGVALSDMWDEYRRQGDAAGYAKTLRNVFFSIAGPLLQSRLALSDAKTKVCLFAVSCLHCPQRLELLSPCPGTSL